jgi:hypothetical protein
MDYISTRPDKTYESMNAALERYGEKTLHGICHVASATLGSMRKLSNEKGGRTRRG